MDEERRLFYVVVTRAKDELYLFSPQLRRMSDGGVFPVEPSMFVKEIPRDLLNLRSVMYIPDSYGGGYGGGGGYRSGGGGYGGAYRGGYGGGYGGSSRGGGKTTVIKKTWRR